MVFEALSDRLAAALRRFSGRGRLTKEDVEVGLREVRVALLEADVNFRVARAFVDRIRERAVGSDGDDAGRPPGLGQDHDRSQARAGHPP
jgi:signal recognition particle subunit SRP54